jgi:5-formyltetrahydrofolate cyclo-ligase
VLSEGTPLLAAEERAEGATIERAKQALRASIAARRETVSVAEREQVAQAVTQHLLGVPELARAGVAALYAALPDEVPLEGLADALLAEGRVLALPRIEGDRIRFVRLESWRTTTRGRFGIAEPPAAASELALGRGDVVLLPGVAFDLRGGRLGRGGGHYDRAIEAMHAAPYLVGVGFAFQLVAQVPMDVHDRCIDAFVCERGLTICGTRDPLVDSS